MGNSAEHIYDEAYRDRYLAQSQTTLGKAIYYSRWALVERYVKSGKLLDYGSGPGAFNACGSDSFVKFNYDINPTCGWTSRVWEEPLMKGSIYQAVKIDILTMWDSIEHVPDFCSEIRSINPEWIFLATPNILACTGPVEFEKHLRLREHIHHFEPYGLEVIMEDLGYQLLETNYDEGKLRDSKRPNAIFTQVYKKRANA